MNPIMANAMLPGRFFFTIGLKYSVAKLTLSQIQPESGSWIRWRVRIFRPAYAKTTGNTEI